LPRRRRARAGLLTLVIFAFLMVVAGLGALALTGTFVRLPVWAVAETETRINRALARSLPDGAIAQEFDALFGGIGKPEVYLYGSHFLSGFLNEKPLARLRTDLAALGLARDDAMSETEDHVACLCEVMRYLIAGDDVAVANLTRQRAFFSQHLQPWVARMCGDIEQHPRARFYSALAGLTRAFMDVEAQGFDMLD
jgi:TorA maturation chaperone TorD